MLTGWFALEDKVPWHLVIFLFAGVFCFVAVSWQVLSERIKQYNLDGAVFLENFIVKNVIEHENDKSRDVLCEYFVVNRSPQLLYIRMEHGEFYIEDRARQDARVTDQVLALPPSKATGTRLPLIRGLQPKTFMKGRYKATYKYGLRRNSLNWTLSIDIKMIFITGSPTNGQVPTSVDTEITHVEWHRI